MSDLTHIDKDGNPGMVDISEKNISHRTATAQCKIVMPDNIIEKSSNDDIVTKKGSVFQTAIIAGIMGAKKTSELIPLCHPIALTNCKIELKFTGIELIILCTATTDGKTGVEMEALTGVSVAALTVYDMCKALSHEIIISEIVLVKKTGGKNDFER